MCEEITRRTRAALIGLGLVLCLTGCTGERSKPGGPEGPVVLPAMSVLDDPVIGVTNPIPSPDLQYPGHTEYTIPIPHSVYDALSEIDDIALGLSYRADAVYSSIELFDYELNQWRGIAWWSRDSICLNLWAGPHGYLSTHSDDPDASFLGEDRVLKVRGVIGHPIVRLYDYHPAYAPVQLAPLLIIDRPGFRWRAWPIATGLAVVDDEIWAIVSVPPNCAGGGQVGNDWLFIVDSTGAIVNRTDLGPQRIVAISAHEGAVWALLNHGRTLATLQHDGLMTERFELPMNEGRSDWSYGALVSAMGRLFVADPLNHKLLGVLTEESLDSGRAVIDWRFSFPASLWGEQGFAWDGGYFYGLHGPHLNQYNLSYQRTGYWRLSVGHANETGAHVPPTGEIAWDGEAFWLLHYGSNHHAIAGLMLSRFKLPEDAR